MRIAALGDDDIANLTGKSLVSINDQSIGEPKVIESAMLSARFGMPVLLLTVWIGPSMVEISILTRDTIEVES